MVVWELGGCVSEVECVLERATVCVREEETHMLTPEPIQYRERETAQV